ncbi:hypothetical protein HDV00_003779 [Rhizophlyctis rosea]|nr:hypothetical protein HDV00_003779 [Rhizophlyctis rosea]
MEMEEVREMEVERSEHEEEARVGATESTATASKKEVVESLEALKHASLFALNSLVRQLAQEEGEGSSTAPLTSTKEGMPASRNSTTLSHFASSARLGGSQTSLHDLAEKAKEIPDGGEIAAALEQSVADRLKSSEILRRSNDMLNHVAADSRSLQVTASSHTINAESVHAPSSPELSSNIPAPAAAHLAPDVLSDHGLALALAALCNGLYQFLEVQNGDTEGSTANTTPAGDQLLTGAGSTQYQNLVDHVSMVQNQRTAVDVTTMSEQQRTLWLEIDRLMVLVQTICAVRGRRQSFPPPYEEATKGSPSLEYSDAKKENIPEPRISVEGLTSIVSAIDRVFRVAPRLDNQSVLLNARQERIMSAAQLTALIQRLNRGKEKFQDQRALPTTRYTALYNLVDQITIAGKRSLSNQRVEITPGQRQKMEMGRLTGIIERQDRGRLHNQDWVSREQQLIADLEKLHQRIGQRDETKMQEQRFSVSSKKQKDMHFASLAARVDRAEERRMSNQDALAPHQLKEQKFAEIERAMDRMSPALTEQRASPRVRTKAA